MSEFLLVEPVAFIVPEELQPTWVRKSTRLGGTNANGSTSEFRTGTAAAYSGDLNASPHTLSALESALEYLFVAVQKNVKNVSVNSYSGSKSFGSDSWSDARAGTLGYSSPYHGNSAGGARNSAMENLMRTEKCLREVIAMDEAHTFMHSVLLPLSAARDTFLLEREQALSVRELIVDYQVKRLAGDGDAEAMDALEREMQVTLRTVRNAQQTKNTASSPSAAVGACRRDLMRLVQHDWTVDQCRAIDEETFDRQFGLFLSEHLAELEKKTKGLDAIHKKFGSVAADGDFCSPSASIHGYRGSSLMFTPANGADAPTYSSHLNTSDFSKQPGHDVKGVLSILANGKCEAAADVATNGAVNIPPHVMKILLDYERMQGECSSLQREVKTLKSQLTNQQNVAPSSSSAKTDFDPLTTVLYRLEETRAENYVLEQQLDHALEELGRSRGGDRRGTVAIVGAADSWNQWKNDGRFQLKTMVSDRGSEDLSSPIHQRRSIRQSLVSALLGRQQRQADGSACDCLPPDLRLNAFSFEESRFALEQQRVLQETLISRLSAATITLRLLAERRANQYAEKPLSVFSAHSISLHQFTNASGSVVRRLAVLYPMSPARQGELPEEQLLAALRRAAVASAASVDKASRDTTASNAAPLQILDLRQRYQPSHVFFEGIRRLQLSYNGRSAYIRTETRQERELADLLCSKEYLDIAPKDRYYFSVAIPAGDRTSETGRGSLRNIASRLWSLGKGAAAPSHDVNTDAVADVDVGWVGDGVCAWAVERMTFGSREEEQRFISHIQSEYGLILHLSETEAIHFAGSCLEVTTRTSVHTVRRQLLISTDAWEHLTAVHRDELLRWYEGEGNIAVVDVRIFEQRSGYSLKAMVVPVHNHGIPALRATEGFLKQIGLAL